MALWRSSRRFLLVLVTAEGGGLRKVGRGLAGPAEARTRGRQPES